MHLDQLRNNSHKILNCETQDPQGLNDFQKMPDATAIAINQVGIERFRLPISARHADGSLMSHDAEATMAISLRAGKTGVNMSRFCAILQEETGRGEISTGLMARTLDRFCTELRDFDHEEPIANSFLTITFPYPVKQPSLSSDHWGWQYYEVQYRGRKTGDQTQFSLQIKYEYSSTCPCSLSLAKQYERDWREGKTQQGEGIATAHGQRSLATVCIHYAEDFAVEELLQLLRQALPTETQSMVKRIDELSFAILNGQHPMFVEHASRRLSAVLDSDGRILDWQATLEHFESLHGHNAVAKICKAPPA